jgi:hypothetical protein
MTGLHRAQLLDAMRRECGSPRVTIDSSGEVYRWRPWSAETAPGWEGAGWVGLYLSSSPALAALIRRCWEPSWGVLD